MSEVEHISHIIARLFEHICQRAELGDPGAVIQHQHDTHLQHHLHALHHDHDDHRRRIIAAVADFQRRTGRRRTRFHRAPVANDGAMLMAAGGPKERK